MYMKFASLYFELVEHNKQEFFPIQKLNIAVTQHHNNTHVAGDFDLADLTTLDRIQGFF